MKQSMKTAIFAALAMVSFVILIVSSQFQTVIHSMPEYQCGLLFIMLFVSGCLFMRLAMKD